MHVPTNSRASMGPCTQTFTNDPSGDFGKWAQNPRVIEMLREAKRLMDEG